MRLSSWGYPHEAILISLSSLAYPHEAVLRGCTHKQVGVNLVLLLSVCSPNIKDDKQFPRLLKRVGFSVSHQLRKHLVQQNNKLY